MVGCQCPVDLSVQLMSVNHDVGMSYIQWRASNFEGRPKLGVVCRLNQAACRDCMAKVEAYATLNEPSVFSYTLYCFQGRF